MSAYVFISPIIIFGELCLLVPGVAFSVVPIEQLLFYFSADRSVLCQSPVIPCHYFHSHHWLLGGFSLLIPCSYSLYFHDQTATLPTFRDSLPDLGGGLLCRMSHILPFSNLLLYIYACRITRLALILGFLLNSFTFSFPHGSLCCDAGKGSDDPQISPPL